MEQEKERRKQRERVRSRRIWAILGALYLAVSCLAGCRPSVPDGISAARQQSYPVQESQSSDRVGQIAFPAEEESSEPEKGDEEFLASTVEESGTYTSKEDVALYIHLYGHLPDNYITKQEAEKLGWDSKAGNLWEVAPGMSIGGGRFGNYEGILPDKKGRKYYECDIGYEGGYRGAERIIYSDDGLIFYTEDHYKTFEELYGQSQQEERQ